MKQLTMRYLISAFCILILCLVLAACGTSPDANTTSTPTAAATTAPMPTPTTPAPTPTPAPSLTTVTGDGYTIGSPSGWTSKKNTLSAASVLQLSASGSDSTTLVAETITSPTAVSPMGSIKGALAGFQGQSKNFQAKSAPETVTIGSIQWSQGAATADDPTTGANATIYVISTQFPGNANKLVSIIYTAKTSEFDKVNTENFQPMLLSFKFR